MVVKTVIVCLVKGKNTVKMKETSPQGEVKKAGESDLACPLSMHPILANLKSPLESPVNR